jgi:transcriptional regulator GlxA family with amidase domain
LKQVHDVLSTAPPDSTAVTKVTLDWGFIHLGEFAARYSARFGVKPSDALAKRR